MWPGDWFSTGLVHGVAVVGDGGDAARLVARRVEEGCLQGAGILGVPGQQFAVGRMGLAHRRVGAGGTSSGSRRDEHPGSDRERGVTAGEQLSRRVVSDQPNRETAY